MEDFDDKISHKNPHIQKFIDCGKVKKVGECWLWMAATQEGYGTARIEGKTAYVHRVSAGITDPDIVTRHQCKNRNCCNPAHLLPGTHLDNARDRIGSPKFGNCSSGCGRAAQLKNTLCLVCSAKPREIKEDEMTCEEFCLLQDQSGLTNEQTASFLQVSLRAIKYWRSGKRKISPAMAELIKIKMGRKK